MTIQEYLRWLRGTSWPLYAALVLLANMVGALAVGAFLRFLLPLEERDDLTDFSSSVGVLYAVYFVAAVVAGIGCTVFLFQSVLRWQRHPDRFDPIMIRHLVLRIPAFQAFLGAALWLIGVVIFTTVAATRSASLAVSVCVTALLGGALVTMLTYFIAERRVRPIAIAALTVNADRTFLEPSISGRIRQVWVTTTAIPVVGIVLLAVGARQGFFSSDAASLMPAVVALAVTSLVTGWAGAALLSMSIADPIDELHDAILRVRRGETDTDVPIYDGSEIGVLQAGFNEMMRGLRDRQRVRDVFGQYVGIEVARQAIEENPVLGGEDRLVAVLFVDVIGSTTFAVNHPPEDVVETLNQYFDRVVEIVHKYRGIINKFEGDAALAVFGAPLPLDDIAGHALAAARELRAELRGLRLQSGIGVAAGHVVAGHIGAHDRFEYTVIGDAVNQAARLTDLAKDTPGRVLTSAATLRRANEAEQARWTVLKSVELRGRKEMTQLARPIRPTLADRSER